MITRRINRRNFIGKVMAATGSLALISAKKSSPWILGAYPRPWAKHDYRVAFDGIAEAGFNYAGLMSDKSGAIITIKTTPDRAALITEEAKSRGLGIASLHGGNFDARRSVDEGIKGLMSLIDSSAICKCPDLLLLGAEAPELVENYYKVIAECCDYAAAKGVIMSVKPHGPLNNTGAECRPLIESIGHKNFKLWYDPGNIYYYSDGRIDPVNDAGEVDGLVCGMSIKDFLMPKNVDVTPGTGMVNFEGVMDRLRKGGFRKGPLIVECLSQGDLSFINSEALKARIFLEKLIS
jgi:sugar phosphate isomerase/epimerase